MNFLVGRRNLACTIFVPFDCDNNCPFCTSKKMYKSIALNPDKIIKQIEQLNNNFDIVEYVLTGGEPFANLEETKRIIKAMKKRCFILQRQRILLKLRLIALQNLHVRMSS